MRKNSWLSQWGVLSIWGIPCLLQGSKKEALFAIFLAGVMALITTLWFGRKKAGFGMKEIFLSRAKEIPVAKNWLRYRGIKKMLRKVFFCFAGLSLSVLGIVKVVMWYSDAVQNVWIILGMLAIVFLIGRRCDVPGKMVMENLWGKAVFVCIGALLLFQIPGMVEMGADFDLMRIEGDKAAGTETFEILQAIQYGVELFLLTLPALYMEICLKKKQRMGTDEKKRSIAMLFYRWGSLWAGFFAVYICLTTLWEMQILKMAPFPYLLLGQTSKSFSGQGLRLETLNFMVTIVSLYFSAIQCMDVFSNWAGEYFNKEGKIQKSKTQNSTMQNGVTRYARTALLLGAVLLTGVTASGCSAKLGEKMLVLIGDENQVATRGENTEFSCMQFLVLHKKSFDQLAKDVLNQPNISYEIQVVYSFEPVEEDIRRLMDELDSSQTMEMVEELVQKGTGTGAYEYVSIREFLNACVKNESVRLPVLIINGEKILIHGHVEYKKIGKTD